MRPRLALPPTISRDRELAREQAGLDIVIRVLSDKQTAARTVQAVAWAESVDDTWRVLAREIVLATLRLEALRRAAYNMIDSCPDLHAIAASALPLAGLIESGAEVNELVSAALAAGVVTSGEIKKAQSC